MGKTNNLKELPMEVGTLSEACADGIKLLTLHEPHEEDVPYMYDQKTGNFHLLPECVESFQSISKEIAAKAKVIILAIESLIENQQYPEIKLMTKRIGGGLRPIAPNKDYCQGRLFANIKVKKGDKLYYLFFISFYTNNKKVNCVLKEYQFRCENSQKAYHSYPAINDSGMNDSTSSTFFNPKIPFECKNNYVIAKCFLDFVMNN